MVILKTDTEYGIKSTDFKDVNFHRFDYMKIIIIIIKNYIIPINIRSLQFS